MSGSNCCLTFFAACDPFLTSELLAAAATVTDIKKNITIKRHIVVFVLSNLCFFVLILSFFWSILYIIKTVLFSMHFQWINIICKHHSQQSRIKLKHSKSILEYHVLIITPIGI